MAERFRTKLAPDQERAFKAWYEAYSLQNELNPDPDDARHAYDYRGWWTAIQQDPDRWAPRASPFDGRMHGPSTFKDPDHPTMWKEEYFRATGGRDPDADGVTKEQFERARDSMRAGAEVP